MARPRTRTVDTKFGLKAALCRMYRLSLGIRLEVHQEAVAEYLGDGGTREGANELHEVMLGRSIEQVGSIAGFERSIDTARKRVLTNLPGRRTEELGQHADRRFKEDDLDMSDYGNEAARSVGAMKKLRGDKQDECRDLFAGHGAKLSKKRIVKDRLISELRKEVGSDAVSEAKSHAAFAKRRKAKRKVQAKSAASPDDATRTRGGKRGAKKR